MSTRSINQTSYGLSQALINDAQVPTLALRAPTTSDKAQIGNIWVDQPTNAAYILTSVVNNVANWEAVGGGGAGLTFSTDVGDAAPAANVIDIAGGTNINTAGAGNVVTINLDENVTITGNFSTTAGNVLLPNTNAGGTEGIISFGGTRFINNIGTDNTFVGSGAGNLALTTANYSVGVGTNALSSLTTATQSTAIGYQAGQLTTTGNGNVFIGFEAAADNVIGGANVVIGANAGGDGNLYNTVAIGEGALASFTGNTNVGNIAIGTSSLDVLLTGTGNVAIGTQSSAGSAYQSSESNNIVIQNPGEIGDNGVIRIGESSDQTSCYIQGIYNVTVTGSAVLCNINGQLGTVSSSLRFKENVQDIGDSNVLSLRPVKFNYKDGSSTHYGLIAEEVENVFKDLVLYDENGQPESVMYHEMPALLLNEIQKLKKEIEDIKAAINI